MRIKTLLENIIFLLNKNLQASAILDEVESMIKYDLDGDDNDENEDDLQELLTILEDIASLVNDAEDIVQRISSKEDDKDPVDLRADDEETMKEFDALINGADKLAEEDDE